MRKRYIEFDILRIIGCFGVIMIHCAIFNQDKLYDYSSLAYQGIKIWEVLVRWAVPTFVMLSGMLIIPKGDDISIKELFRHRVLRMLIVYIVWSCVYSFYNTYVLGNIYAPTKLKTFIDGCFSGEIHMWYLPMLAGLYLISPLLTILVKNISKKWTYFWLSGLVIFSSIIPFIELLDIKYISVIITSINNYMDLQFLGGWTLYFVLGYFINNHKFNLKEKNIIYCFAVVALIFTFYGTVVYSLLYKKTMGILSYEYPNILFLSIGVFVFFKEELKGIGFTESLKTKIINVSNLTFGIYLIHVLLLKIWYAVGFNIQIFHPVLSVPFVSFIVFISGGVIIGLFRKIPLIGKYLA